MHELTPPHTHPLESENLINTVRQLGNDARQDVCEYYSLIRTGMRGHLSNS